MNAIRKEDEPTMHEFGLLERKDMRYQQGTKEHLYRKKSFVKSDGLMRTYRNKPISASPSVPPELSATITMDDGSTGSCHAPDGGQINERYAKRTSIKAAGKAF